MEEGKDDNSAIYVAGEEPLPDSNEDNTVNFPFEVHDLENNHYLYKKLPWRKGGRFADLAWPASGNPSLAVWTLTVDEGITRIGNWWFEDLKWLQEVSLPPTLESIGEGAFKGCERLPKIAIPNKVKI